MAWLTGIWQGAACEHIALLTMWVAAPRRSISASAAAGVADVSAALGPLPHLPLWGFVVPCRGGWLLRAAGCWLLLPF